MSAKKDKSAGSPVKTKLDPRYAFPKDGPWANAWKVSLVFALVGVGLSAFGAMNDPDRFAYSWLFAFFVFLTMALGMAFITVTQHLAAAAWGVTIRRIAECFAIGVPVFALLFAPVVLSSDKLYEWKHHGAEHHGEDEAHEGEEHGAGESLLGASTARAQDGHEGHGHAPGEGHGAAAGHGGGAQGVEPAADPHNTPMGRQHGHLLEAKAPYLNWLFFLIRAGLYFLAWALVAGLYFSWSTAQDKSRDPELTKRARKWSPAACAALGFTVTFAAFDWLMSLEPTWYSTIFGVYIFATCAVSGFALTIVVAMSLKNSGVLGEAVHTEHFHDLGKLLFGFNVFWAYIGFSQMMLIWYAGIPEEATYYQRRWMDGGWQAVGWTLIFGHFVAPFLFLMSRNIKRRNATLGVGALWMLVIHVVDIYWFVMPYASDGLQLHWMDLACLMAVGGVYFTVVFEIMKRFPLIPIGDPLLERALSHEIQNA